MARAVLDTIIVIELFDRGREELFNTLATSTTEYSFCGWFSTSTCSATSTQGRVESELGERKSGVETLGRVVWMEQAILRKALEIDVAPRHAGRPIPFSNLLIAATALALDAELVTRDEAHYRGLKDVRLVSLSDAPRGPEVPNRSLHHDALEPCAL